MTDLSTTILAKSDQLNADDLVAAPITIKITKVSKSDAPDQPISINYEGDKGRPWKPCKSMRRILVQIWGADGSQYVGRRLTLYRDAGVKFGGMEVGGIRISHMSNIDKEVTLALTATRANKKPFTVRPLKGAEQPSPDLIEAGNRAAAEGVAAYTVWLQSLDAETKATVRGNHADWSKIAKEADTANNEEEIPL
jgi:hypothetical protein